MWKSVSKASTAYLTCPLGVFRKDSNGRVSGLSVFAGWNGWIHNERLEKVN
jgi:hypothetical protein